MNTEKLEQWVLLKHSGELSPWKARRLERHLAQNAELRQFDADLRTLNEASRAWQVEPRNSDAAVAMRAQLAATPDRRVEFALPPSRARAWQPILLGAAALLLLGLGLWFRNAEPANNQISSSELLPVENAFAWNDEIDAEMDSLEAILAATGDEVASLSDGSTEEESLVNNLLALEGIKI